MVRHLLMVVRLGPQPTVGLVPVEEPEQSSRSPRAEIRVADGTQENSNERQPNAELHSNVPDSSSNRTAHTNQLNSSKKLPL